MNLSIATLLAALAFASPASAADTIMLNCKVGEAPVWVSDEGFKCETVARKCPDGWHLVLTQSFAPICAWVLREPGY